MGPNVIKPSSRPGQWSSALERFLLSPRGFVLFITVHLVGLMAWRLLLFPGMANDDAEQLLFGQALAWGYDVANPPLFTWAVIAVQQALGSSIVAVTLVRFAVLWGVYLALYAAARTVVADPRLAVLAALMPLATYLVGWDAVFKYTHSLLLLLACLLTWLALVRLDRRASLGAYLGLGAAIGFGCLSKYPYALFLASLAVAALFDRGLRRRLADVRILITIGLAAAIAAPAWVWIGAHWQAVAAMGTQKLQSDDSGSYVLAVGNGLLELVAALFTLAVPAVLLWPMFLRGVWRRPGAPANEHDRLRQVLGRSFLIGLATIVVAIPLLRISTLRPHLLFFLVLVPAWAMARAEAGGVDERARHRLALILVAVAIAVQGGLVAKSFLDPRWDRRGRHQLRYDRLAAAVAESGFRSGTIVADAYPYPIEGGLVPYFPEARVASVKYPWFTPPRRSEGGRCLILRNDGGESEAGMAAAVAARLNTPVPPTASRGTISLSKVAGDRRPARFFYVLVEDPAGDCR